jgi:hypothetical protein
VSDLNTFVESSTTISSASSPTVQSLNVGLFACYHNHYAARVKLYPTSSVLTELVTDGFSTSSAAYKAATVYADAPNAPAQFAIGRRALPPTQTLQLTCTDGTVGDQYSFTVVGSDGKSHSISYTNVANQGPILGVAGSSLTGNATLVPGSATVTFAAAQTLTAGSLLQFSTQVGSAYTVLASTTASTTATLTSPWTGAATSTATTKVGDTSVCVAGSASITFGIAQSIAVGAILQFTGQPGVFYALSALVVSSTAGTLTTNFNGTSGTYPTTVVLPLSGTFHTILGSSIVATTSSQILAVSPGDSLMFTSQLGTTYTVAAVTSATSLTLTTPYTGTTTSMAYASDMCQVSTAATNLTYQLDLLSNIGTVSIVANAASFNVIVQIQQVAGLLNDIQSWRSGGFTGQNAFGVGGTLLLQDTTADPGLASDLTAMVAANGLAFFGIMLDSNSAAEVEAAASFIEAQQGAKFGFFNNSDYGNCSVTVTTDLFSELQDLSYKQSLVQQNNQQLLCYAGSATCGQLLAMNPGSYTATYKALPGVPADNDTTLNATERSALNTMTASDPGTGGKNGNYYVNADNVFTVWPGSTPSGQFCDLSIGVDALNPAIQVALVETLASLPKVPLDNFGIGLLGDAVTGVLNLYASPAYNFILPSGADPTRPLVVNVPDVSDLTPAQRASRNISGITWSAGIQGAIETATVAGELLP